MRYSAGYHRARRPEALYLPRFSSTKKCTGSRAPHDTRGALLSRMRRYVREPASATPTARTPSFNDVARAAVAQGHLSIVSAVGRLRSCCHGDGRQTRGTLEGFLRLNHP